MAGNKLLDWEGAVNWLLDQPDQAELARAAYFDQPTSVPARRYHGSAEFAELRRYLPKQPGRALDLGAGNGILSFALAVDGWQVTAVEPDPSALIGAGAIRALAKDTGTAIDVVEAFGEAIPLEAANYDLVIARQVLHHANDLGQFCREMARLARPGGLVITLRDHVISSPKQLPAFLAKHPLHHLYGGENAFEAGQYRDALTGAGLRISKELGSFASVINYDPMRPDQVRSAIADRVGGKLSFLAPPLRAGLSLLPLQAIGAVATLLDKRPGRLVSFICEKEVRDAG